MGKKKFGSGVKLFCLCFLCCFGFSGTELNSWFIDWVVLFVLVCACFPYIEKYGIQSIDLFSFLAFLGIQTDYYIFF